MSKFRKTLQGSTKTTNLAGGEAYTETPELELVSLLLTSFVSDKFYESEESQLKRLEQLVNDIKDKKFIGQAAVFARQEFGMRSITHALIGELVKIVKTEEWLKFAVEKTVRRPDDMLEMVAYYSSKYGKPYPNSLKKGIRLAFKKFNGYQLAKYKGNNSSLKLVDLLNYFHPKATKDQEGLFKKLIKGELKSTETWESKLTKAGQDVQEIKDEGKKEEKLKELKSEAWGDLISNDKLGYFALLRNLRNIIEQAPESLDDALKLLENENKIKKSLVLPFRFATAADQIKEISGENGRKTLSSIHRALDISLSNVPSLPGRTLVALDDSGSMEGKPMKIGSLFAAILYKANNADLLSFSNTARSRQFNTDNSALSIAETLEKDAQCCGTNFHSIFEGLKEKYDRIIILSDMQGWVDNIWGSTIPKKAFEDYKKRTGANPNIFSFDLAGHGSLQFPERNVYCLAGFSDKIFDVMKLLEEDRNALINKIKKIRLEN